MKVYRAADAPPGVSPANPWRCWATAIWGGAPRSISAIRGPRSASETARTSTPRWPARTASRWCRCRGGHGHDGLRAAARRGDPRRSSTARSPRRCAPGAAMAFGSGYCLAFKLVQPPDHVDVLLLAPRLAGRQARTRYQAGEGFWAVIGVEADRTGQAQRRLLGLAEGLGVLRAGAMEMTAAGEAALDLFVEQTVGAAAGHGDPDRLRRGHRGRHPARGARHGDVHVGRDGGRLPVVPGGRLPALLRGARPHRALRWHHAHARDRPGGHRDELPEHPARTSPAAPSPPRFQEEAKNGYPMLTIAKEMTRGTSPVTDAEERLRNLMRPDRDHHDRRRQLSAAGLARRSRAVQGQRRAAHPHAGGVAGAGALAGGGAGRRGARRGGRDGARRHRCRQRRRAAPRVVLQPVRQCAGRRRSRPPRQRHRAAGPAHAGAADVGPIERMGPVSVPEARVPAQRHRPADQDHGAGAVHAVEPGPGRALRRSRASGHGLRGGGQRRAARAGAARRLAAARRALSAGASRPRSRLRPRGHRPGPGRAAQADVHPPLLRLRVLARAGRLDEVGRLRVPHRAGALGRDPGLDRGRPAPAGPGHARKTCRRRRSCSACWTWAMPPPRRPTPWRAGSRPP